jgi:serine/threonine protein kinase
MTILFTFVKIKLRMEIKKRYPRVLSSGANNTVIALSEFEVGKLFIGDTRSDIGSEAEKMRFANAINGLIVKFIRLDISEVNDAEMLVMERLFPMDFRAFEYEKRELMLDVFQDELEELHKHGFVHRDLQRPSNMPGMAYDNIFLTDKGLRLIDTGISAMKHQVGERLFERYVQQELEELERFKPYFLNR